MGTRLQAQLHEIRLDIERRRLRHQEQLARRHLGELIAARRNGSEREDVARLAAEVVAERREVEAFEQELRASLEGDRADLARVSAWMRPAVIARGLCARAVLRHRRTAARRALYSRYQALGALAASTARGASAELAGSRAALERLRAERQLRLAAFGETAHPKWITTAVGESAGLGRAILRQLRSSLMPKGPALAGMAVGWWIANTYTDSRLHSALRSIGIGHGGTHVVSDSTLKAMSFWLPLLAAAVCAYLGERVAGFYRGRGEQRETV
ncbi:MAG TPA: hypothetical protein VJQ46_00825 [Gemmatimonadales bacterium]|nr:hypothetical protein [Gemmatimonadales bacterium]